MELVNFISYIGNNLSLDKDTIMSKYFSILEKERLSDIATNVITDEDIKLHGRKAIGEDRRVSATEWHVHHKQTYTRESSLTGRTIVKSDDEWIKLSLADSLKREERYLHFINVSAKSYKEYISKKHVKEIRNSLESQASHERVMKFLNCCDKHSFFKNELFYSACERYLDMFSVDRKRNIFFTRKSVGGLVNILNNRIEREKQITAKRESQISKTFKFEVKYGEYEVFSEEDQDEIISNLLLELGYSFDDLSENWEIERDGFNLKVEFGDNYSFKISFSKKGKLEIGSMGRNRLKIKEVE